MASAAMRMSAGNSARTMRDEVTRRGHYPRNGARALRLAVDADDASADPVGGARAAVPDLGGDRVLLGLAGQVGRWPGAPKELPGRRHDLVIARGAGAVWGQVLAARFAEHDRVGDRPAASGSQRGWR